MEQRHKGARLKMSRRHQTAETPQPIDLSIGPKPDGPVLLSNPNQGPPAAEGSWLSLQDFKRKKEDSL